MIRRFNKVKNIGRFADLRSQSGHQGDFRKLNIVYAQNGSGKSTLCDVFRSFGTVNPDFVTGRKRFGSASGIEIEILFNGTPAQKAMLANGSWTTVPSGVTRKVMVYDERFVADNVHIGHHVAVEQRRNLYGLVIGEQGLTLKGQVDIAETELTEATNALNASRISLTACIPPGWTDDAFRALTQQEDIDDLLAAANEELEKAKNTKRNDEALRRRSELSRVDILAIPSGIEKTLGTTFDTISQRAEKEVVAHLDRYSRGLTIGWLETGFKAQKGSNCPHCGQDMDGLEILKSYRSFFSGELQKQQEVQSEILSLLEKRFGIEAQQQLTQRLQSHSSEKEWWAAAVGLHFPLPTCKPVEDIVAEMEAVRVAVKSALLRKQGQPGNVENFTETEQAALDKWAITETELVEYNDKLTNVNLIINECKKRASTTDISEIEKRISLLEARKKRFDPTTVSAFANFDAAVTTKAAKERKKTSANKALKDNCNAILETYGNRINALLASFQADFRVVSEGVSFKGGPPSGELAVEILGTPISTSPDDARNPRKPSLANTLSGGDRSALGLAYFLAVVEHDPDLSDTIVVFDDPFHSQDRSRRRRTIEYIHRIADNCKQCFVLSHDLDFAREAARISGVEVGTFNVSPMTDHALLQAGELPPLPGRAYESDYRNLKMYLADPTAYADRLKGVTRCLRQTLEGYLHTKFPDSWEENDWLGDMIGKIRSAQSGDLLHLAAGLVPDLTSVNDYSKRFYHGETDASDAAGIDPRELKGYVEQTLKIISR